MVSRPDIAEGGAARRRYTTHVKIIAVIAILAAAVAFVVVKARGDGGAPDAHRPAATAAATTPAAAVELIESSLAERESLRTQLDRALGQIGTLAGPGDADAYREAATAVVEQVRSHLQHSAGALRAASRSLGDGDGDGDVAALCVAAADALDTDAGDLLVAQHGITGTTPPDVKASGSVTAQVDAVAKAADAARSRLGLPAQASAAPDVAVTVPPKLLAALSTQFDNDDGVRLLVGSLWLDPLSGQSRPALSPVGMDAVVVGDAVVFTGDHGVATLRYQERPTTLTERSDATLNDRRGSVVGADPGGQDVWLVERDAPQFLPTLLRYGLDGQQHETLKLTGTDGAVANPVAVVGKGVVLGQGFAVCGSDPAGGITVTVGGFAGEKLTTLAGGCHENAALLGVSGAYAAWWAADFGGGATRFVLRDVDTHKQRVVAAVPSSRGCIGGPNAPVGLSADARWLAVPCVAPAVNGAASLDVIDTSTGRVDAVDLPSPSTFAWAHTPHGDVLYVATLDTVAGSVWLYRVQPRAGAAPVVTKAMHPVPGLSTGSQDPPTILAVPRG